MIPPAMAALPKVKADLLYADALAAQEAGNLQEAIRKWEEAAAVYHNIKDRMGLFVEPGDEVMSLNRAFMYAGAPSVMGTLWQADDQSTTELMTTFYKHLRSGMGRAEALRQAQIHVRSKYPSPYFWASFVLTGRLGILH